MQIIFASLRLDSYHWHLKKNVEVELDKNTIRKKLKAYQQVDIALDLKSLPENQKQVIEYLVAAGKVADQIFWQQSSPDALKVREQYKTQYGPIKEYIEINYGPYDRLHAHNRFVGTGPDVKPPGAGFYPEDLSRKEFLDYLKENPGKKDFFENLYTVISRTGNRLQAQFYHEVYQKEIHRLSIYLENAVSLSQNISLNTYLLERSQAMQTDQYYLSDLAWMNLNDNLIDIVIGPIENYEDRLFNYKTAYEAAVMIKDIPASEELEVYKRHLNNLEQNLPVEDNYKKTEEGSGNILEIVNIAYFGGDFQAGVKTIAVSLPNDEKVISEKGAKKQLYKNIMEAKFDQILVPIAGFLIDEKQKFLLSKERFISQVLLHEISHTIGPNYVTGKSETVRKSLQEKYSIIEECKADILGIYAVPYFTKVFSLKKEDIVEHYVAYVAGLFRSIRFGVEEAHGLANLIQLNFLTKRKVMRLDSQTGRYSVDFETFHRVVTELARILLKIEAHGDYEEALKFIDLFGQITSENSETIGKLNDIPIDLDLKFDLDL
jgi:hypothetical protein